MSEIEKAFRANAFQVRLQSGVIHLGFMKQNNQTNGEVRAIRHVPSHNADDELGDRRDR